MFQGRQEGIFNSLTQHFAPERTAAASELRAVCHRTPEAHLFKMAAGPEARETWAFWQTRTLWKARDMSRILNIPSLRVLFSGMLHSCSSTYRCANRLVADTLLLNLYSIYHLTQPIYIGNHAYWIPNCIVLSNHHSVFYVYLRNSTIVHCPLPNRKKYQQ